MHSLRGRRLPPLGSAKLQHEPFERLDGDRPPGPSAHAGVLARMRADIGAGALQDALAGNQLVSVVKVAARNRLDVCLDGDMVRTGRLARPGKVRLPDMGVTVMQRQLRRRPDGGHHLSAEVVDGAVAVRIHIVLEPADHGPDDIIAADERFRADAEQVAAAQDHLDGGAPIRDAARRHHLRLHPADLADFIGVALRQRFQP